MFFLRVEQKKVSLKDDCCSFVKVKLESLMRLGTPYFHGSLRMKLNFTLYSS